MSSRLTRGRPTTGGRRVGRWQGPARDGSIKGLFLLWLVCVPIAYFFVQLTRDVPIRGAEAAAAAFGWHGERGTLTVTHTKAVYQKGTGKKHECYGDFRPRSGGDAVSSVRVHLDGKCRQGRAVEVRLIRKDSSSWLMPDEEHDAYAGHGAAEPLLLLLFMGAFCLIVGGPFIFCAVVFPVMMAMVAYSRRGDASV